MYKIMTKLHTQAGNIYAMHTVTDEDGEAIEYSVETPEEAAETALDLLKKVGYADLRIMDDQSYYLDLIYGIKPEPEEDTYTVTITGPDSLIADPALIEDISFGDTVESVITFSEVPESFHLIIDGEELQTGLPEWISYAEITNLSGTLTFADIEDNHVIEIVVDSYETKTTYYSFMTEINEQYYLDMLPEVGDINLNIYSSDLELLATDGVCSILTISNTDYLRVDSTDINLTIVRWSGDTDITS